MCELAFSCEMWEFIIPFYDEFFFLMGLCGNIERAVDPFPIESSLEIKKMRNFRIIMSIVKHGIMYDYICLLLTP